MGEEPTQSVLPEHDPMQHVSPEARDWLAANIRERKGPRPEFTVERPMAPALSRLAALAAADADAENTTRRRQFDRLHEHYVHAVDDAVRAVIERDEARAALAALRERIERLAERADSLGHHWSGMAAHEFFGLASDLRAVAATPSEDGAQ